ncbi:hypothetical protein [Amycolatopsis sp. H20-H5]|uniref:hypothetical protein n=1 Tax=Amycolatopsis sp. H20-H5 TaxID=3046309 RepID=UPI002DBBD960|nr:hypothetical protein [Amycolatopsis sp. H20-H5]MEC3974302.1 hypothetical protein [Amycolatopsis sp. H20-H5]
MEARPGKLPADADQIPCTNAVGWPGDVKVFTKGVEVVLIVPPGEAAVFTPGAARQLLEAILKQVVIADTRARHPDRYWPTESQSRASPGNT